MSHTIINLIHAVSELERKCRDALQHDTVFQQIRQSGRAYDQLCALLDFIGDSENALLQVATTEKRNELEPYFLAYGILQTMYSRQVALRAALETLKLKIPERLGHSELITARDRVIGHVVTAHGGGAHVILRNTLTNDGFEYASYYKDHTKRGNQVHYEPLLTEHLTATKAALEVLFGYLAEIENARRRQMRQNALSPIFHGIGYSMQCIAAALVEPRYGEIFSVNADSLLSALNNFRSELAKRYGDERASEEVNHVIEGIRMLRDIYPPGSDRMKSQYQIIVTGVEIKMKHLMRLATEIDERENEEIR
jgi:hypothetical protein